jgi:hypothetical protein
VLRVAIDGPPCADPDSLGASLVEPLLVRGHPVAHVRTDFFWRDASVRLEHGREDVDAYPDWLDSDALRREVLAPVAEHGEYLPSLRDPLTDRSTREPRHRLAAHGVLLVTGGLLLGSGLPFDRTGHLSMSPAARARRTPVDETWTLPAFDRYDAEIAPARVADVVVRLDDPRHPAVQGLRV